MFRSKCAVVAVAVALAGCAVEASPSMVGGPREDGAVVVAESGHGHGTVSGPVRRNNRGLLEVRMPGGTWIDCGRSCSDTLRRETVDFWESRSGRNNTDGRGYLRWGW
jgi:hypothetical protein